MKTTPHFTFAGLFCDIFGILGRQLQVTVRPMLQNRCPVCLSVCNVYVGLLWPNGCVDQDATWYGRGPGDIVLDGDPAPSRKGAQHPPLCGPSLWPNGWKDPDATFYGRRHRPRRHCVRWETSSQPKRAQQPPLLAHVCCGQTVAHLNNC